MKTESVLADLELHQAGPTHPLGTSLEEARAELRFRPLRASGGSLSSHGMAFDQFDAYQATRVSSPPRDHHVVTVNLGATKFIESRRRGDRFAGPARAGESAIMPAGLDSRWDGRIPAHLRISVSVAALDESASQLSMVTTPVVRLRNEFRLVDPFLEHVAAISAIELLNEPHPAQRLIIDSLAVALSAHLIRAYSGTSTWRPTSSRLGEALAVKRALDYIHDRPTSTVTLDQLAAVAQLSKFHFSRIFTAQVGISPIRYVESLRIDYAKRLLRSGHLSIAEVAYAVGFSDQSHFARRFWRHVGCSPRAYVTGEV